MTVNITPIISKGIRYKPVAEMIVILSLVEGDIDKTRRVVEGSIISGGGSSQLIVKLLLKNLKEMKFFSDTHLRVW